MSQNKTDEEKEEEERLARIEREKKYPPCGTIYYLTTWEEYLFVRTIYTEVIVVMWVKKGIAPVLIATPTFIEMAAKDPTRIWCICDVDKYPPLAKTISIYPTFRTFTQAGMCREFKSGTSRAGILQDFDRLFKEIADPTYHPPEDLGVFEKVKIETKKGVSAPARKGKAVALAGDEKNVVLVKPHEAKNKPDENTNTVNNTNNRPQTLDEYVAVLTERGFFKGLDIGSPPYMERYNVVKERFMQSQGQLGRTTSQQSYSGNSINNSINNSGGLQRSNSQQQQQQTGKKLEDKSEQINSFGLDKMKVYGEYKWSKTPHLMQISAAGQYMWGLDSHGMCWRWTGTKFEQIQGQLRQISVSYDGQVWGVSFNYDVMTFNPVSGWQQIPGKLKQVSVANADLIWGVTLMDESVVRKGNNWEVVV